MAESTAWSEKGELEGGEGPGECPGVWREHWRIEVFHRSGGLSMGALNPQGQMGRATLGSALLLESFRCYSKLGSLFIFFTQEPSPSLSYPKKPPKQRGPLRAKGAPEDRGGHRWQKTRPWAPESYTVQ